jgi:hypothetical protein
MGPCTMFAIPYGKTGSEARVTVASVSGHVLAAGDDVGVATCATDNPKNTASKIVMQRL